MNYGRNNAGNYNGNNGNYNYPPRSMQSSTAPARGGGLISLVLVLFLTAAVIAAMLVLNSYSVTAGGSDSTLALMDAFRTRADNVTAAALGDVVDYKRSFYIPEDTVVCNAPNPDCYGSTADNQEMRRVISYSDLADYGEMVWKDDIHYYQNTPMQYYSDPSIFCMTWKECDGTSVIDFAEVYIADGSQFRRFLCDNTFGSNNQKNATSMAKSVNAVIAMNGDFYGNRQVGVCVYQGKVYRNNPQFLDQCFIDANGDMIFKREGELGTTEEFQKFVDDNNIKFSLSFGPILVEDHKAITRIGSYNLGEVHDIYARAAFGMIGPRHYLFCLVEGQKNKLVGTDIVGLAKIMGDRGCEKAYTIDGGQTAVMIINKQLFNRVVHDAERAMSDIIYFATAVAE